jgi:hypothetical protein
MSNVISSRRALAELGAKSQQIVNSKTYSNATKKSMLDDLEAELNEHLAVISTHEGAKGLMVGGNMLGVGGSPFGRTSKKGLNSPSIGLSPAAQQQMFLAAKSGQNLTIEVKDAASSDATRTQLPAQYIGLVDRRFEPTRILDHIPSTPMAGPSVEFIVHTGNTPSVGAPVITLGTAASGGSFAAGTYFWKLTATNTAGETIGSNELTATLTANQKQPINWTAITGADGYRLYRGTVAGGEDVLVAEISGGTTATYTDLGGAGTSATVPLTDGTSGAATVAPGGLMPETSLPTTSKILVARKIGIFTTVVDELLSDFETFGSYLEVELTRQITDAENWQLLQGDGTGENLLGLLNVTGTLTRAKGASDTALDIIEEAISDLRTGPTFCKPDSLIIHPATWSTIRRTKNTLGNYVLGDPGQTTVSDVWGIPVIETTQCPPGTAVLGNLEIATQAFIREGVSLQMSNSGGTDFESGKVKIRSTERLTLGVSRPTALNIITGL